MDQTETYVNNIAELVIQTALRKEQEQFIEGSYPELNEVKQIVGMKSKRIAYKKTWRK